MGGVIGATSGKFVLMGAALLLHGRADDVAVQVAVVPGAPVSAMTSRLADRLGSSIRPDGLRIHLRAETFAARIAVVEPDVGAASDLRLGQDVLNDHPVEIDFAHRQLQPLSPREAQRFEARARPVAIRRDADGTLSVDVAIGNQAPVPAKLDLSSDAGFTSPDAASINNLSIGGVAFPAQAITKGRRNVVGLYAFKQMRVIFDLAHDRIWVRS